MGLLADTGPFVAETIAVLVVLGCAVAIADTAFTLRETIIERQKAGTEVVLIDIANANVRREVFRICELAALLLVGLNATRGVPIVLFGRMMILYVVIMLSANARLDRHERRRTDTLIRETHVKKKQREEYEG